MALNSSACPLGNAFSLALDSGISFDVRRVVIDERMSTLFTIKLEAFSTDPAIDLESVVGQAARFTISRGGQECTWTGICQSAELFKTEEDGLSTYEVGVVPLLWLLTQRKNRRIFQHLTEPDIVKQLLSEHGIAYEARLSDVYKQRPYRVQYDESDYAFMMRMLEDAGIASFFETKNGETILVLSDAPQRAEPRAMHIPYKADITMVTGEYVTNVKMKRELKPGRVVFRDREYRSPAGYVLGATAKAKALQVETQLEQFEVLPGRFLVQSTQGGGTPIADDQGTYRSDERHAERIAQKEIESNREDATVISFETNAYDLAPGMVMHVDGHAQPALAKSLLIVARRIEGTQDGDWTQYCEARSIEQSYRPPKNTKAPRVEGLESATVVGPAGEEIHCDERGRVRVSFHWDRESEMDEHST